MVTTIAVRSETPMRHLQYSLPSSSTGHPSRETCVPMQCMHRSDRWCLVYGNDTERSVHFSSRDLGTTLLSWPLVTVLVPPRWEQIVLILVRPTGQGPPK